MPELSQLVSYYLRIFLLPFYFGLIAMVVSYIMIIYRFFSGRHNAGEVLLREKIGLFVIFMANLVALAVLHYLASFSGSSIATTYQEAWYTRGIQFVVFVWFLNGFYWMVYLAWKNVVPLFLRYFLLLVFLFAFSGVFMIGVIAIIESSFANKLCFGITCGVRESLFDYLNSL